MSIFPYVYYMVSSFHVTDNEQTIAMYAGMVTSSFAFAEFSTGVFWGRLSDRFGRKPILLTGLAGTGVSMIVFGFSPNLATALIARALGGLLNGYATTNIPELTMSLMPISQQYWCLEHYGRRSGDDGSASA